MSRGVLGGVVAAAALVLVPLGVRGDAKGRPAVGVSEACGQSGQCCAELQSVCIVDGQVRLNMRSADGQPCSRPKPQG